MSVRALAALLSCNPHLRMVAGCIAQLFYPWYMNVQWRFRGQGEALRDSRSGNEDGAVVRVFVQSVVIDVMMAIEGGDSSRSDGWYLAVAHKAELHTRGASLDV